MIHNSGMGRLPKFKLTLIRTFSQLLLSTVKTLLVLCIESNALI